MYCLFIVPIVSFVLIGCLQIFSEMRGTGVCNS
jgi:hypothetical protein